MMLAEIFVLRLENLIRRAKDKTPETGSSDFVPLSPEDFPRVRARRPTAVKTLMAVPATVRKTD
jgi:hypothetical protein